MPESSSTSVGYPEIKFWLDYYLCIKISSINKDALCSIKFYNDLTPGSNNYENIFSTFKLNNTNGTENYDDPGIWSLFNVQTLKKIISAGEGSINIIENTSTSYGVAILPKKAEW